jgi:hypothetical protein
MFSGGIGSWAAAARVVERHGPDDVTLLFADTRMEDPDLYRFLEDAQRDLGVRVTTIADGRDIWGVFRDVRFLGNTRVDPCSRVLKREPMRKWLEDRLDPDDTTVYLGYEWTEPHRVERAARFWAPWRVESPMAERPYLTKQQMLRWAEKRGLRPPRLYDMGFAHNNCGGGCVKAGIGQFAQLYDAMPEVYASWEDNEQSLRDELGDVSILRDRTGGDTTPLTLRDLRLRIESGASLPLWEVGGCACLEAPDDLDLHGPGAA